MARVLLVEDDTALVTLLLELFSGLGLEVVHTEEREQAIDIARAAPPDLIVTDLFNQRDNRQAWAEIEALRSAADQAPVLVVTGYANAADEASSRNLPVLLKPFDLEEFEQTILSMLDR